MNYQNYQQWLIGTGGHSSCLKEGMYDIPYYRFDTIGKALSWTLHMMEKTWHNDTYWEEMVRAHHKISEA